MNAETKTDPRALEAQLLRFLLERMPQRWLDDCAVHWREEAAGDPDDRVYIAELLEGKRGVPRGS